jgi:hypothetical protein
MVVSIAGRVRCGDLLVESSAGTRGFRYFSRNLFRALEPAGGSRLPRSS